MKALTVRQPHASLVAIGAKTNETRSWYTSYRGPLAIHASAKMGKAEKELCWVSPFFELLSDAGLIKPHAHRNDLYHFPLGAVIATCRLVTCMKIGIDSGPRMCNTAVLPSEPELSFGDYTPGRYALILADVKQIEPIPCRGRLGLWNLPEEIVMPQDPRLTCVLGTGYGLEMP